MAKANDYPGMPRWVKISGLIVAVLISLAAMIVVFDIGGPHGPGRHMSPNSEMPPAGDRP
ncbi:hypothetical protein [Sinorhizobium meliloti]|nr:hypothetical protein [Sinorhizobium meliloti]WGI77436.1 hypothetical protein QC756_22225 [Sinorhizobium meliloti]WQO37278.1 hypothetical protein U8C34_04925 [Sinorhizobium meliloti]WQO77759.1 hypothetical protein U8C44_04920 [Sinorhizobium meliloti]WQP03538.1 hypothetical protein U8C39_02335 [Sinorhizobium meliloti]WQP16015.1 hypothetical protein U8C33_04740 [Sinorhizobium meliloti]